MKKIAINDVTLRDAAKKEGLLTFKEKLEIAKILDELKVDVIYVGSVNDPVADPVLFRTMSSIVKNSVLCCTCFDTVANIDNAYSAVALAKQKRLQVVIPSSPVLIEYFTHKKPSAVLNSVSELVSHAVSLGCPVEVMFDDATRAEMDFLAAAVNSAVECGAEYITLTDNTGSMLPAEFADYMRSVYAAIPVLKNVKVNVQCADTLSLADACTIEAIGLGADGVFAATGVGNVPSLDNLVRAFSAIGDRHGFSCGLKVTAVGRLTGSIAALVRDDRGVSGQKIPVNTGTSLSKENTAEDITICVKSLGYDLSDEDYARIYEAFLRVANKKSSVGLKELDAIVASSAMQVPATYTVVSYVCNTGNIIRSTAAVTLKKNNADLFGLSSGDGPIDAAFFAIEQIVGHHFELEEFAVQAVTEGREAMGETVVKLRHRGKLYAGRGISTDIIGASVRAYVNALNKIVYEEKNI